MDTPKQNRCPMGLFPAGLRSLGAINTLSRSRWEQYLTQKREDRYIDNKTAFMRERAEMHKSWAKSHKAERKRLKSGGKMK